jgi:putative peptidoglycan lipid II flippase
LVYGVIIGSALHLLIQVPGLRRYGFRWTAGVGLLEPGMRKVLRLLGPRVATKFFIFMFFIVRDNLASNMGEGAVTALNLGWFIMQVPETLLGTAMAITLLPTISEQLARGQTEQFRETMNGAVRALLAFTIPSAVLLAVGIEPLVETLFGFSPEETALVVLATRAYLLGLAGHALLEIASRAFYAQQNAMVPLYASALNAAGYVVLAITLSNALGFVGIALANSTAFTIEALALLWLLARRFPGLMNVSSTALRAGLASAGTGLALYFLMRLAPFSPFFAALGGLTLAGGAALVFVWPEVKLLLGLGAERATAPMD